jgi:hypothetical protein
MFETARGRDEFGESKYKSGKFDGKAYVISCLSFINWIKKMKINLSRRTDPSF